MTSRVWLSTLGLLCLHTCVCGQDSVQPGVLIFCDDPSVIRAAHGAITKFNSELTIGHKVALFQILTASKAEDGADSVYSLQFTSRRSSCSAAANTTWTDCDYLPLHQEPFLCNGTVVMSETDARTTQVDCQLNDLIFPEKASCLGCPQEIDENSDDLKVPLLASINKFNSISDSTHLFTLHSVARATRQVIAGFRFKLMFDMRKTTCAKSEHADLNELCVADEKNVEFANCNSTVDMAPWRLEPPQAQLECEQGALPMVFSRRRPPGWSPLRNFLYDVRPIASPSASASPTKAAVKEESSEEDVTASKPSAPPPADAANNSPFHCPSKPWRPFPPVGTADATETETSNHTASFSDADLLG